MAGGRLQTAHQMARMRCSQAASSPSTTTALSGVTFEDSSLAESLFELSFRSRALEVGLWKSGSGSRATGYGSVHLTRGRIAGRRGTRENYQHAYFRHFERTRIASRQKRGRGGGGLPAEPWLLRFTEAKTPRPRGPKELAQRTDEVACCAGGPRRRARASMSMVSKARVSRAVVVGAGALTRAGRHEMHDPLVGFRSGW